jgi:uncharacterized protein (TIGR01319 family)
LDNLAGEFRTAFPEVVVSRAQIAGYIEEISQETSRVPQEKWHAAADAMLARLAVGLAVERHVGKRERIFTREGETWLHYGKDMRETRTLIGTGGVFIYNPYAAHILTPAPIADDRFQILQPKNPRRFVDSSYLLYAVGLLAESYPHVAARIIRRFSVIGSSFVKRIAVEV